MRPARMSATMSSTGEIATGVSDLLVMGVDVIGPARRHPADACAAVRKGAGCGPWVDSLVSVALGLRARTPGREPGRQATVCQDDAGRLLGRSRMNRQTPIIAAKPAVQHGGRATGAREVADPMQNSRPRMPPRLLSVCWADLFRDRIGPRWSAAPGPSLTVLFGLGGFSAGGLALGAGSLLFVSSGLGRRSCLVGAASSITVLGSLGSLGGFSASSLALGACSLLFSLGGGGRSSSLAVGGVHFTSGESVDGHQLNQSHTHGKNHFFHTFLQKSELVSERPDPDACTFCCACQSTSGSLWPSSQAQ